MNTNANASVDVDDDVNTYSQQSQVRGGLEAGWE